MTIQRKTSFGKLLGAADCLSKQNPLIYSVRTSRVICNRLPMSLLGLLKVVLLSVATLISFLET